MTTTRDYLRHCIRTTSTTKHSPITVTFLYYNSHQEVLHSYCDSGFGFGFGFGFRSGSGSGLIESHAEGLQYLKSIRDEFRKRRQEFDPVSVKSKRLAKQRSYKNLCNLC
jgi:hypothetical protein